MRRTALSFHSVSNLKMNYDEYLQETKNFLRFLQHLYTKNVYFAVRPPNYLYFLYSSLSLTLTI